MKESITDLIIRDLLTESCGEIDLTNYKDTISESISYYFEKEQAKLLAGFSWDENNI